MILWSGLIWPLVGERKYGVVYYGYFYRASTGGTEFDGEIQMIHNGLGCVIAAKRIGDGTQIYQNVTIGSGHGEYPNVFPTIGRNCKIYSGAVVIGDITIGDNCIIGANAVVNKDIPPNCVAVGVPSHIIEKS